MRVLAYTGAAALVFSVISTAVVEWVTPSLTLVPNFLRFTLHHNEGIAFGMRLPENLQFIVIVLALVGVTALAIHSKRDTLQDAGFGLIIGGALGNIIDRLLDGLVTDFISVGTFPTFNVADACISIGVGLLIVEELRKRRVDKK